MKKRLPKTHKRKTRPQPKLYNSSKLIFPLLAAALILVFITSLLKRPASSPKNLVTAREAASLCLNKALAWQKDAQILEIDNTYGVNASGQGDGWLIMVISPGRALANRYQVVNGECQINLSNTSIPSSFNPLPQDWLDSPEVIKIALQGNLPAGEEYSLYLNRQTDWEKYASLVWSLNAKVKKGEEIQDLKMAVDAISGRVWKN